ncbi:MAG: hypothetical protein ACKORJ_04870 [Bacteroidota bacterium]
MSDNLKSIIDQNRQKFDHLHPRIETRRQVLKAVINHTVVPIIVWKAAAVLFFASTLYLGLDRLDDGAAGDKAEFSGFREVESFYKGELNRRVSWLEEAGNYDLASRELIELESMYEVLYEQWTISPTKRLQDAMTLNLIVRVKKMDELLADKQWQ